MAYQIDPSRLLLLLLLLGAGMFGATRLVPLAPPERERGGPSPRRLALRGMSFMTLLGLASGIAGGLLEGEIGAPALIRVLHTVYSVCWAPAFAMAQLQEALASPTASSRFTVEFLGLLAYVLIPVLWFLVFLCVGQLLARLRRSG